MICVVFMIIQQIFIVPDIPLCFFANPCICDNDNNDDINNVNEQKKTEADFVQAVNKRLVALCHLLFLVNVFQKVHNFLEGSHL